jgi:acyl-CoA reductase-like NAD-dependent aldehyde dehydrogenase
MAFVNAVTKSDTMFPTGGVMRSGFGREGGLEGYSQFANIRTVYVNHQL